MTPSLPLRPLRLRYAILVVNNSERDISFLWVYGSGVLRTAGPLVEYSVVVCSVKYLCLCSISLHPDSDCSRGSRYEKSKPNAGRGQTRRPPYKLVDYHTI